MWSLGVILYIWSVTTDSTAAGRRFPLLFLYSLFFSSTLVVIDLTSYFFPFLSTSLTGFPPFAEDENWNKKTLFKQITGTRVLGHGRAAALFEIVRLTDIHLSCRRR